MSMNRTSGRSRLARVWIPAASALCLAAVVVHTRPALEAQTPAASAAPAEAKPAAKVPDLAGIWNGAQSVRPINSETAPWGKDNFPVLNERGLAYQKVFDEAIAPKYDCVPASSPAIQYDPYMMEVVQWPDRVLLRYEKDDQLRTVWLDGRKPTLQDIGVQGFSVGHYEGDALMVETDHFTFDITGFDDYNGIPSSQQKRVLERYWREGNELKATVTVEDPMFLRKPASYTTRWLPAPRGYKLMVWDCDPETSRLAVQYLPPKYK